MPVSSHPFSQEQLMAYLDGELSPEKATAVMTHLQHCRECQELAADLQSVSRSLFAWQIEEPSPVLTKRLQASSKAPSSAKKKRFDWFSFSAGHYRTLGAVSGVILLAIISATFSRRSAPLHEYAKLEQFAKLEQAPRRDQSQDSGVVGGTGEPMAEAPPKAQAVVPSGPLIIRTAQLSLTTGDFPHVRENISRILKNRSGYIAQLEINTPAGEARSLDSTLRIPAALLDAALLGLKQLGHVDSVSQRGEEVTQRVVDTQARLSNLRTTEARLTDILRQRTGKLADVLAVEEQVDSVRGQIENIEAEQKGLNKQIDFAAVQLRVREEYKKPLALNNVSLLTQLRNATIQGFQTVADIALGLLLFLLSYGPTLLIIAALLFYPVRVIGRNRRHRATHNL